MRAYFFATSDIKGEAAVETTTVESVPVALPLPTVIENLRMKRTLEQCVSDLYPPT